MPIRLNINCDLGEGGQNDAALMPYIQSCNIACGGHYGDENSIRAAILLAKKYGVRIGAHPSYPDKENFGRKIIQISNQDLKASLIDQITLFQEICNTENIPMHHLKLHGALYNQAAKNEALAQLILGVIDELEMDAFLYVPAFSVLEKMAKNKVQTKVEAFIDRTYQDDYTLTPRTQERALITQPEEAWNQLREMHFSNTLKTVSGKTLSMKADTYCIHGDSPEALTTLRYIQNELANA